MMESRIQEITAFRITIERRKLARDEKSIQIIFEVLEECGIPCECMAINIDWLAVVVREPEREKLNGFMLALGQRLSRINISIDGDICLLYIENGHMTSRGIGMIVTSLALQDIDVALQRYIRCEDRLVIGVAADVGEKARRIIAGILDSHYQL